MDGKGSSYLISLLNVICNSHNSGWRFSESFQPGTDDSKKPRSDWAGHSEPEILKVASSSVTRWRSKISTPHSFAKSLMFHFVPLRTSMALFALEKCRTPDSQKIRSSGPISPDLHSAIINSLLNGSMYLIAKTSRSVALSRTPTV